MKEPNGLTNPKHFSLETIKDFYSGKKNIKEAFKYHNCKNYGDKDDKEIHRAIMENEAIMSLCYRIQRSPPGVYRRGAMLIKLLGGEMPLHWKKVNNLWAKGAKEVRDDS